ncbi:MAG: phosphate starvation-inducible protein PhoH [Bacteroidetes bacterium]|nr:phosphate starvation-inducible protein PhoH [Bacteroidota bacterium]MBQ9510067.1 PhoH family protein [Bacteroidales bacterium]
MENLITLDPANVIGIYGHHNANIDLLRNIYPKLKITARGNEIKVIGEDSEVELFTSRFELLLKHFEQFGKINENDILNITASEDDSFYRMDSSGIVDNIILHGREGRVIKAITPNQRKMVESAATNDMVFAIGPAGTGKTYTAVALAVRALKNKQIRRVILTRPAVEAGENLGFLPGDLRDKLDPYLQPLYDALWDMMPMQKLISYLDDKTIEIAPLAFMRGRTLDNAYVILDEAQNATESQIKMFLTRMGRNAKFFITGDITQIDLPKHQKSGLIHVGKVLKDIKGIDFIYMDNGDVVRHQLVTKIIQRFEQWEEAKQQEKQEKQELDN